jgi:hypothetical protein
MIEATVSIRLSQKFRHSPGQHARLRTGPQRRTHRVILTVSNMPRGQALTVRIPLSATRVLSDGTEAAISDEMVSTACRRLIAVSSAAVGPEELGVACSVCDSVNSATASLRSLNSARTRRQIYRVWT